MASPKEYSDMAHENMSKTPSKLSALCEEHHVWECSKCKTQFVKTTNRTPGSHEYKYREHERQCGHPLFKTISAGHPARNSPWKTKVSPKYPPEGTPSIKEYLTPMKKEEPNPDPVTSAVAKRKLDF